MGKFAKRDSWKGNVRGGGGERFLSGGDGRRRL